MSLLKPYKYNFDEKTGVATFTYNYKGKLLTGTAKCHEDDEDFKSPRLGIKYAELRAYLLYLKKRRDELNTRLSTLEGSLNHLITDPLYDKSATYHKKHLDLIADTRNELLEIRAAIKGIKDGMKEDIEYRTKMYDGIRRLREKEKVEGVE